MPIRLPRWLLVPVHPGLMVLAASLVLNRFAQLPPVGWLAFTAAGGAALCLLAPRIRWAAPARLAGAAGVFLLALGWCGWTASRALNERIVPAMEGRDITVVGLVEQMPQLDNLAARFVFLVQSCEAAPPECRPQVRWRLNWAGAGGFAAADDAAGSPAEGGPLLAGQQWRLVVRLRRPHSPLNPAGFDGELRALEDGIAAVGNVRQRAGPRRLGVEFAGQGAAQQLSPFVPTPRTLIERLRGRVRDAIAAANRDAPPPVSGVLQALVVGDQSAIAPAWWDRFNRTGIGHLVSISGTHVTMLAGLASWLVARLWSSNWLAARSKRALADRLTRPKACWLAAFTVAFAYSALAGWGVPAQRTCWMLAIAGWANLSGRASSLVPVMASSAAVIVLFDPWAAAAPGFWLSFGAVAAIVYAHQRQRPPRERRSGWAQALSTQAVVTLAMVPLGALFFSSLSLVSPLANAVAIPVVSLLVTPLALVGAMLETLAVGAGSPCWWVCGKALQALLAMLTWLDGLPVASVVLGQPGPAVLLLAAVALLILLSPVAGNARLHACWALAPVLLTPVDEPPADRMRITAIDIGQGTAVLVETPGYRLLYDTGPSYPGERDAGSRLIVPFLHARGIRSLDMLVVSHLDNDHSGGARSVMAGLRVARLASSLPLDHPIVTAAAVHESCRRGTGWVAGDYHFDWLHPPEQDETSRRSATNARSCVLRIRGPAGTVLLPGDLERAQEARLLALYPRSDLKADLLFAPHHGSATSSSQPFLDAVDPALVVFQVGYRNRFRHPDDKVWKRYAVRQARLLRSDDDGAISIELQTDGPPQVWRLRHDQRRYWRVTGPERAPVN